LNLQDDLLNYSKKRERFNLITFFKSLITKIKEKFTKRVAKSIAENMTPVYGTIIYLEKYSKGKFQYKIIVRDTNNRTVMLMVKNKVNLKKGDRIEGYFSKEDRTALIQVA